MVLLNKAALSSFDFHSPNSLLFFQCALCVLMVQITASLGVIKLEPWNLKIVRAWLPVNLIFVGMIATSFLALKDLGKTLPSILLFPYFHTPLLEAAERLTDSADSCCLARE